MRAKLVAALYPLCLGSPVLAAEQGQATYYENPHYHGMVAAHKSLPFGSRVKIHNLDNGREAVVTIVDRGPFARGRIIDVSTRVAGILGFIRAGVAHVTLEPLYAGP